MITTSTFITTIIKDILDLPLVGKIYKYEYGASNHIFSRYTDDNKLGKKAAKILQKVILDHIKNDKEKQLQIFDFMNKFLTEKEKQQFKDISDIVSIGISKFTLHKHKSKIKVVGIKELVKMDGWSLEKYHRCCMKMWDSITDEGEMPEEHKGNFEQWDKLKKIQPDNFKILLSGSTMIGFWDFLALFDDAFEKAKKGELVDSELITDITPYMLSGTYNIYITSVMLDETYRKSLTLQRLLFSIIETLEEYALNGIFINEICAWAYSDDGIALSKSLGLNYLTDHKECGKIYCSKTIDLINQPICDEFKTLKALYIQHFKV